jgi:hypothetical protein
MKIVFAPGAIIERWVYHSAALRARRQHGLSHQEIEDKPDGVGDEDYQDRPERAVHPSALRITINIAYQEGKEGEDRPRQECEEYSEGERGRMRIARKRYHVHKYLHGYEE